MALTVSNIKKYLLCFLYLTTYENVNARRLVMYKDNVFSYLPTYGTYDNYYLSNGKTPTPYVGDYGTPSVGVGYYYASPSPFPSPSPLPPPPPPRKSKKSKKKLALGLGLGLGLGIPVVISGVAFWFYKHPSALPCWMWRPL